jgi:hypothetical protein
VACVLIAIVLSSKHQGLADGRRDVAQGRSTLKVVALALPRGDGNLARDLRPLEDNGAPIPDPPPARPLLWPLDPRTAASP